MYHRAIAFREWGDARAPARLIALHGVRQSADSMAPLAEALLELAPIHVVAPELVLRGGRIEQILADEALELAARSGERAIWFGTSLGARIAASAVLRRPSVCTRLFLAEAFLGIDDRHRRLLLLWLGLDPNDWAGSIDEVDGRALGSIATLIYGEKSGISVPIRERAREFLGGAPIVEIEGATHDVVGEGSRALARLINPISGSE